MGRGARRLDWNVRRGSPTRVTDLLLGSRGMPGIVRVHRTCATEFEMVGWLDRLQRKSRVAGFLIAVVYKYVDDQGSYLAALITYYAFVALFPALLLLTTVVGVLLVGHPGLQEQILHSAVAQFPVIGDQLGQPQGLNGGTLGVVIGITGALYGGLGVGQAVQNAMATLWAVPRNDRPDPLRSRLRSVLSLLVLGSALIATTVLSAVSRASESFGFIAKAALVVAAVLINADVCGRVSGRDSPGRDVPTGDARRTGGGDRMAAAAVVRGGLRGAHRQVGQRHQQRVRPGSRVAGLPVPDRHDTAAVRRSQCGGDRSPLPACPADTVHPSSPSEWAAST